MAAKDTERIKQLEMRNLELFQIIAELTIELQQKNNQVAHLREWINDLERELWSLQSELENLRGY